MLSKVAFYLGALSSDCDRCHCSLPLQIPISLPYYVLAPSFPFLLQQKIGDKSFHLAKFSNLHRLITRRTDCVCQGQGWFVRGLARLRYLVKQCPISSRGEIVEITAVLYCTVSCILGDLRLSFRSLLALFRELNIFGFRLEFV
jgi:hypothetical protein